MEDWKWRVGVGEMLKSDLFLAVHVRTRHPFRSGERVRGERGGEGGNGEVRSIFIRACPDVRARARVRVCL